MIAGLDGRAHSLAAGAAAQSNCRCSSAACCSVRGRGPTSTSTIKGVNDELRRNVLTYLSFERYKKRPNIDRDTLDRLLNRVDREVQAALEPFGYYEPKVEASLEDRGKGNWRVHIQIDPGQPVIMDERRRAGARARGTRPALRAHHGPSAALRRSALEPRGLRGDQGASCSAPPRPTATSMRAWRQ